MNIAAAIALPSDEPAQRLTPRVSPYVRGPPRPWQRNVYRAARAMAAADSFGATDSARRRAPQFPKPHFVQFHTGGSHESHQCTDLRRLHRRGGSGAPCRHAHLRHRRPGADRHLPRLLGEDGPAMGAGGDAAAGQAARRQGPRPLHPGPDHRCRWRPGSTSASAPPKSMPSRR